MTTALTTDYRGFDFQSWAPVASSVFALLAVLIASVSCLVSYKSYRKSSRSLELSEIQEKRKDARLSCEVLTSGHWPDADLNLSWIGIRIAVANGSDRDGSIHRAEIVVNYPIKDKNINQRIECWMEDQTRRAGTLKIPHRLESYSSARGWLFFPIHGEVVPYREVTMVSLELHDTRDITETVPVWPIREMQSDPRT